MPDTQPAQCPDGPTSPNSVQMLPPCHVHEAQPSVVAHWEQQPAAAELFLGPPIRPSELWKPVWFSRPPAAQLNAGRGGAAA